MKNVKLNPSIASLINWLKDKFNRRRIKKYHLFLELTNLCSASCQTCLNRIMSRPRGVMDFEFFKKIVDLTSASNEIFGNVEFCGVGESYLVKNIKDYFDYAIPRYKERGISTTIVTNGSHTTFIPSGISHVDISFNAGRKETYEAITGLNFEKVLNNIKALDASGQLSPPERTHIHMLVFEDNKNEIMDFVNLFKDTAATLEFSFKYENQCDVIDDKTLPAFKTRTRYPCMYATNSVFVCWNGVVIPCPHDFHASVIFGDLNKNSIGEILSSPARIRMETEHRKKIFRGICENCNYNITFENKIFMFKANKILTDPVENKRFRRMLSLAGLEQ